MFAQRPVMPTPEQALPGRAQPLAVPATHEVLGTPLDDDFPGMERAMFGLGCFWGAERKFWQVEGVVSTAVGYAGGFTENPHYKEVCSGRTGHNEVVRVIFDPAVTSYDKLLEVFWEAHDPTQHMRQGNDIGTQYRTGIYPANEGQTDAARASLAHYQARLSKAGRGGDIATEIVPWPTFYFAEDYHQQYLAKNPGGYCGLGGTGVSYCP